MFTNPVINIMINPKVKEIPTNSNINIIDIAS